MKVCLCTLLVVLLIGCSGDKSSDNKASQTHVAASALASDSVPIPGTSVSLPPPCGFVRAERFPGFMNESTGSSIMVSEIPGPYAEITAGFSDSRQMQTRGMTLLDHSSVTVDGQRAMLLHVEQAVRDTLFRKWMLAIDRHNSTTIIIASFPKAEVDQGNELRAAILAAAFGKPKDPTDALVFDVTPVTPFQVAKVMGQNMILSPEGSFPLKGENVPFMIFGLSASKDLVIANQKEFAERRVTDTATIKNIIVEQTVPLTIGHCSGYATIAHGVGEGAATPLTIYQVLLFDESGYCVIQGITPTSQKEVYVPVFKQIAKTFKMKTSHNRNVQATK